MFAQLLIIVLIGFSALMTTHATGDAHAGLAVLTALCALNLMLLRRRHPSKAKPLRVVREAAE